MAHTLACRCLFAVIWFAGTAAHAAQGRTIVSVLAPLAYGPNCWSSVELQNLGTLDAVVTVEAHKGSGALVALAGASSVSQTIVAGEKARLRLQVEGEESQEGWVRVTERVANGQSIAVSGTTECTGEDKLTTIPQTVAFPVRDPWLSAEVAEITARTVMILNTSGESATANACYSHGSTVTPLGGKGPQLLCTESAAVQIPPFGTRMLPVTRDGSTQFVLTTRGEALVLRALISERGGMKAYTVDSTVKFGEPVR